jgi:phosphoenolpyruvate carboxykinase (GTP)
MANKEFLSIPIGSYLENHIDFGKGLQKIPKVFYVNYFLRNNEGDFTNTKMDKKVWVRWMERRILDKVGAYATPIGFIPKYEDLKVFFSKELGADYPMEDYEEQFMIRIPELLGKLTILKEFYDNEDAIQSVPEAMLKMIEVQEKLLLDLQKESGDYISPLRFQNYPTPEELSQPF